MICFAAVMVGRVLMQEGRVVVLWMAVGAMFPMAVRWWRQLVSGLRVRIRGENGTLHVRVGPTWWGAARTISIAEIAQVFVREQPHSWIIERGGYEQLCALDRNGRVRPLVGWMTDLREARALEEQLEQILGIEDAPVPGEIEGKTPRQLAGAPSLPSSGNLSLPDASTGGELSVPGAAGALSDPE